MDAIKRNIHIILAIILMSMFFVPQLAKAYGASTPIIMGEFHFNDVSETGSFRGFDERLLNGNVRMPDVEIRADDDISLCEGISGVGCAWERSIYVVVNPDLRPATRIDILVHEIGHVFDWMYMNEKRRAMIMRMIRRDPRRGWTEGRRHEQRNSEAFATLFEMCWNYRRLRRAGFEYINIGYGSLHVRGNLRRACRRINIIASKGPLPSTVRYMSPFVAS